MVPHAHHAPREAPPYSSFRTAYLTSGGGARVRTGVTHQPVEALLTGAELEHHAAHVSLQPAVAHQQLHPGAARGLLLDARLRLLASATTETGFSVPHPLQWRLAHRGIGARAIAAANAPCAVAAYHVERPPLGHYGLRLETPTALDVIWALGCLKAIYATWEDCDLPPRVRSHCWPPSPCKSFPRGQQRQAGSCTACWLAPTPWQ
jgi:hypothetical protein